MLAPPLGVAPPPPPPRRGNPGSAARQAWQPLYNYEIMFTTVEKNKLL